MAMDSQPHAAFTCDLSGKVALVTGASSGIGAHVARTLAAAGARVAVAARRRERLSEVVDAIAVAGGKAAAVRMDVTDARSIEHGFEQAQCELGAIDVLVNNAGIAIPKAALDVSAGEWDDVLAVNLRGPFLVAQNFARRVVERKGSGTIVNVGSIMGERVAGLVSSYAASKAALLQLTRALALEWARYGIRVNAIAPGYIETDINKGFFATPAGEAMMKRIPQRRLGRLEDLDGTVLLLCSDASAYMTGAIVAIDGGHLVSAL
jgi:NAD(P)-dependent dehydrogenase (short-subunit alcohol dehydrogenase family)